MPSSPPPPDDPRVGWFPVAAATDVPLRHTFHGVLLGQELALWRAEDGYVNVWENRCPHRGVRLSIGISDGHELSCRYHGWRYANRTGGCTYMPVHPGDSPSATFCARTFSSVERYGLIWTTLAGTGDPPAVPALDAGNPFALRGVPFDVPAQQVVEAAAAAFAAEPVVLFVQPADAGHCILRGVLAEAPLLDQRLAVLRQFEARIDSLREGLERSVDAPAEWGAAPVVQPRAVTAASRARIPLVVRRKWRTAQDIAAFELAPLDGTLPTFQPGAHLDLHLPNGLVRQYSITNGPGEQTIFRIAVKLEPASRGGSSYLHESLQEGDEVEMSGPHHNFRLRRDAASTLLLAGGVGLTPLLAMAQALHTDLRDYELHVFAQSDVHVAFPEVLSGLGHHVIMHVGLTPAATAAAIEEALGAFRGAQQVYVCGPVPMLDAARAIAARLGWPESSVHYEYFANSSQRNDSSTFEVELARSQLTFTVQPGQSLLHALRAHGVQVESSCEQGACGTCVVGVVAGEPDHQDVYLRPSEHEQGTTMTVCVSRARSPRLVLDL
jgi:ferredoxin-NADP reductase/nitrite reductase/ring-hydroxylating ferredoxin subunit